MNPCAMCICAWASVIISWPTPPLPLICEARGGEAKTTSGACVSRTLGELAVVSPFLRLRVCVILCC